MTIRPVEAELFRADGQTDMTKLIVFSFRNFLNTPNKTIRHQKSTLLHFLFLQYILSFSCLIHLTASSISISFSSIFFSITPTLLTTSHVFPVFIFRFFPFHSYVVHSLSTFFHLEAMFSQFFFPLNKKYVPEYFILLCRSASDVAERPGSITVRFKCFSTYSPTHTSLQNVQTVFVDLPSCYPMSVVDKAIG